MSALASPIIRELEKAYARLQRTHTDLPEDIIAPLGDHFDLLTWSGREAMPEVTLTSVAIGNEVDVYLDGDAYDPSSRDAVYDRVFSRASALLGSGHSVLIDATFIDPDHRSRAMDIARQANAFMQTIWLDAPVSALIDRVTNRHGDASDADENVVLKQIAADTAPDDWQVVSAAGDIEDTIALAQTQLNLATVR